MDIDISLGFDLSLHTVNAIKGIYLKFKEVSIIKVDKYRKLFSIAKHNLHS